MNNQIYLAGNKIDHAVLAFVRQVGKLYLADEYGNFDTTVEQFPPIYADVSPDDKMCHFFLNELLEDHPVFKLLLPQLGATMPSKVAGVIQLVQLKIPGQFDFTFSVINGGLSKIGFAKYQQNWLSNNGDTKFLTWQPSKRRIDKQEPIYLYYLCNSDRKDISHFKVVFDITNDDGTHYFYDSLTFNFQANTVFQIPVGFKALPTQIGTGDDAINLHPTRYNVYLKIPVLDSDGNEIIISETRTYVIDNRWADLPTYFLYKNSFGLWDTLRFFGQKINTTEVEYKLSESYDARRNYLAESQEKFSVVTGNLDADWLSSLQDLIRSKVVYVLRDGLWVEVYLDSKSLETLDTAKLFDVAKLDFRYAGIDRFYSK